MSGGWKEIIRAEKLTLHTYKDTNRHSYMYKIQKCAKLSDICGPGPQSQSRTKMDKHWVIHLTFSHVLPDEDTVSLFSPDDNKQMEKKNGFVCVLYLSLLLRGFEEQRINHCDGVSLNVLIRPVPREEKNKN